MDEQSEEKIPWNKITVAEMQDLMKKLDEFYAERGYPKQNLIWLADMIIKRLRLNKDFFLVGEGERGSGKSTLVLLLALMQCRYAGIWRNKITKKICKVLPCSKPPTEDWEQLEVAFDFEKNMSFLDDSTKLLNRFNSLDRYHPFLLDEGSKNLHKYMWNTEKAFKLINSSNTERYQNKSMSICIPNFQELNSVFRNDRVAIRLFVFNRNAAKGYASCILSLKDMNRHILDVWHVDESAKMYEYYLRRIPVAQRTAKNQLWAERKLKNYAGYFEFPSLEKIAPRIWGIYERYKIEAAQKDLKEEITEKESKTELKWKLVTKRLIQYMKQMQDNLTDKDIRKIMNISQSTFSKLIKIEDNQEPIRDENERPVSQWTPLPNQRQEAVTPPQV